MNKFDLPPPFAFVRNSDQKDVLIARRVKRNNATNSANATMGAKWVLNAAILIRDVKDK